MSKKLLFQFSEDMGDIYRGSFGSVIYESEVLSLDLSIVKKRLLELYRDARTEKTPSGELKLNTSTIKVAVNEDKELLFQGHISDDGIFLITARV